MSAARQGWAIVAGWLAGAGRHPAKRLGALMAVFVAAFFLVGPAAGVEPDETLADPRLEARARDISAGLRCLVCQNQSIDDSHAPLARDLRKLVRERLVAGDSDQAARNYIVQRYGDFVLLKPPLNFGTALLWLAPLLLLSIAIVLAIRQLRSAVPSTASGGEAPLSPDEQRRLEAILKREG